MKFSNQGMRTVLIPVILLLSGPGVSSGLDRSVETPKPVSGHAISPDTITPADVFARVQLVRKELDDIRFEMGMPATKEVGLLVKHATTHEVFFQARTLERKVARLVAELTGKKENWEERDVPEGLRPFHSWKILDHVLQRILRLKPQLNIHGGNSEAIPDPATNSNQVFFAIGLANQQLNRLLTHQFTPHDVMEQVTLGIRYVTSFLHRFPAAPDAPQFPEQEHGREPWDVYFRLSECYEELGNIARASDMNMLTLATKNLDRPHIQPNDVYDLATLIISELAYLHAHLPQGGLPDMAMPPRPIVPSHVYQQAGGLLSQLKELKKQVQANPEWLHQ